MSFPCFGICAGVWEASVLIQEDISVSRIIFTYSTQITSGMVVTKDLK